MAIEKVSALVLDGLAVFEFGVICEVFGIDRSADGVPNFDFKVCGPEPGKPIRTSVGRIADPRSRARRPRRRRPGRDPGDRPGPDYLPEALEAVRAAADAGAIILTVCSGAFVAGEAGPAGRAALHHPLDARRRAGPPIPDRQRWTATCCSSTTAT